MKQARVFVNNVFAGVFEKLDEGTYRFKYITEYQGAPISLTMPVKQNIFEFKNFPAFFEGLLPEGNQLEALLRKYKLDKQDYFGQLIQVGNDLVGAITVIGEKP